MLRFKDPLQTVQLARKQILLCLPDPDSITALNGILTSIGFAMTRIRAVLVLPIVTIEALHLKADDGSTERWDGKDEAALVARIKAVACPRGETGRYIVSETSANAPGMRYERE